MSSFPEDGPGRRRDRGRRSRFVTLCQQVLALAVVVAVLTPAARTVTMEVKPSPPIDTLPAEIDGAPSGPPATGTPVTRTPSQQTPGMKAAKPSKVPTKPVRSEVVEYALTSTTGATKKAPAAPRTTAPRSTPPSTAPTAPPSTAPTAPPSSTASSTGTPPAKGAGALHGTATPTATGSEISSDELPVHGYGTVGVTWSSKTSLDHDQIQVRVRTRTGDTWSGWTDAEYHEEHGPDPKSEEGKGTRPGTDALLIGDVDAVQVKIVTEVPAPADLKVAVIDPGETDATAMQKPAIDTSQLPGPAHVPGDNSVPQPPAPSTSAKVPAPTLGATTAPSSEAPAPSSGATPGATPGATGGPADEPSAPADDIELQKASYTPKPTIYSRAQWGANEKIRDKPSLHYYEIHGGFVHHTVNANNYTPAEVPGIIRGIYNYHVKTRGWSDIGYNFLVDKWGRIWEGRYGGVDRPVVGAHTKGYNEVSFSMSAIGNFETMRPSAGLLDAYGKLFAWKLSLHGVSPTSTNQKLAGRRFNAISGHRDAGQTACPGRYLYAQLGAIRVKAKAAQSSWIGRELESNMIGSGRPELVVRRKSDGRGIVLPIVSDGSGFKFEAPVDTGQNFSDMARIWKAGDWDRDGRVDVMGLRKTDYRLVLFRGLGGGKLAAPRNLTGSVAGWRLIAPAGDVTGDGWPDLMAQPSPTSAMRIYPGHGLNGFYPNYVAYPARANGTHIPLGRLNADGAPDSLVRRGDRLDAYLGNGPGGWTAAFVMKMSAKGLSWVIGVGGVDPDARPDLVVRSVSTGGVFIIRLTPSIQRAIYVGPGQAYDLAG